MQCCLFGSFGKISKNTQHLDIVEQTFYPIITVIHDYSHMLPLYKDYKLFPVHTCKTMSTKFHKSLSPFIAL